MVSFSFTRTFFFFFDVLKMKLAEKLARLVVVAVMLFCWALAEFRIKDKCPDGHPPKLGGLFHLQGLHGENSL